MKGEPDPACCLCCIGWALSATVKAILLYVWWVYY
jgi:hypothetical protein